MKSTTLDIKCSEGLLETLIAHKDNLDVIANSLPCSIHINAIDDFRLLYLDPRLCRNLGFKSLKELGDSAVNLDICHPDDLEHAKKVCIHYLEHIDDYSTYSFVQRVKYKNGNYHALYTTGMVVKELGGLLQFSVEIQNVMDQFGRIDQIIEDTEFARTNFEKIQLLSSGERSLLPYWLNNTTTDEIQKKLNLTPQSIKTYKKRIFKKLEVNSFVQLYEYGRAFDLVKSETPKNQNINSAKSLLPEIFHQRKGYSSPKYPGFYHLHYTNDFTVLFMDEETCKEFESSLEEIQSLGGKFLELVTHPEDVPRVKSLLKGLVESNDENKILTYFHRIVLKPENQEGYTMVITSVRLDVKNGIFYCMTNSTDQLQVFSKKISDALNNSFNSKEKLSKFEQLTRTEKKMFALLSNGMSTREVSKKVVRSVRTIEQHKKNIYKKLNINKLSELVDWSSRLNQ
ncbi:LuxR C-terminal-related transcriptional regulator [Reichenbachiella versicolor]|uniref:LuxR C-terminal-related transcriptional regulator n=1 Tax=Reichenbachiella versicolor TaxID=1821036 RepID=UPI000D6E0F35|nr:LuxR C-terminal-related transcriptional regulator [Reichenbachiella versicolor]